MHLPSPLTPGRLIAAAVVLAIVFAGGRAWQAGSAPVTGDTVEVTLGEYADIVECAAIGVRTHHGDDEVMIALIVHDRDAFDPSALMRFLEPRMPKFMLPRYVEVFDDFPRDETSMRVRKHDLRARGITEHTWDREAVTGE